MNIVVAENDFYPIFWVSMLSIS